MPAGGQRGHDIVRAGGAGSSSTQNRDALRRIELNADRPGIRDVDLALKVKDLLAGRALSARQAATHPATLA